MSVLVMGLALALAASAAQGAGFLAQHIDAAERPAVTLRHPWRTLVSMLSSGWWRIGLLFAGTGFMLHLGALALAPISLVQAFVAGGLALTAPMAALVFHHKLTSAERRAIPLMALSLAGLSLGIAGTTAGHIAFDETRLAAYLGALGIGAMVLSVVFQGRLRQPALAAGLLYAVLDSATKGLADVTRQGGTAAALDSPFLLAAIAAGIAAFFCFQRALQLNRPLTAIAVMEAGATGGGVLAGFIAFGDPLGATPALDVLHLAAFIGVGVAAWILAPAQARVAERVEVAQPSHPSSVAA